MYSFLQQKSPTSLLVLLAALSTTVASTNGAADQEFWHPLRPIPDPLGCGIDDTMMPCPTCDATPRPCKARIRRSWGTLSDIEKQQFIDAINIMKTTPTTKGQQMYGSDFTNYDELTLQHAAAVNDPRGDQGHLDQHFVVFHRMLLLKFENSLLAVDPTIAGAPYWDLREGPDAVFASPADDPLSFGSVPGTGPNHEVMDGAFANWTVSSYDPLVVKDQHDLYDGFGDFFSNATGTTLLRTSNVANTNSLVRYPSCSEGVAELGPLAYSAEDYETCVSQTTFAQFNWCLESETTNWVHGSAHFWIGSADSDQYGFGCPWFSPPNVTMSGVSQGDYFDKSTSPNDPIFWLHHAFLDMMSMHFMRLNPLEAEVFWSFKASNDVANGTDPVPPDGSFLSDVISSSWPFEGSMVHHDDAPQGPLTFADALCYVGPETAIYTYDTFENDDPVCGGDENEGAGILIDDFTSMASSFASTSMIAPGGALLAAATMNLM